jgi:hypothetical protein
VQRPCGKHATPHAPLPPRHRGGGNPKSQSITERSVMGLHVVVDTVRLPHGHRQTQDQTVLSATRILMLHGVLFSLYIHTTLSIRSPCCR